MEVDRKEQRPDEIKREKSPKSGYLLKKMDLDTARVFNAFREKANKKDFGREITDTDILAVAVRLLTAEHIKPLQEATYSDEERLHIAHQEYQRVNGKLSLGHFISKLLGGEIQSKK